ncbi:hypothetical protein HS088_TW01G00613 [Tripterygium wilfordii]|uniref:Uncharacterized protein n=1 Tax=Tripterygium wilfordii TaxID=458696 RepID=A0A7J7E286_TRIWF|nr:uncharacterized membrane protein At1g75140-like [Tripterygium wilfordii]KAF5752697.1 hypothetical protein HS088_TW01G00613 [Tripterygium wilfordii]
MAGKLFFLLFIFASSLIIFVCCMEVETEASVQLNQQVVEQQDQQLLLLNRLEELVKNLSEIVNKLESTLSPKLTHLNHQQEKIITINQRKLEHDEVVAGVGVDEEKEENKEEERMRPISVPVTKYGPTWSERFQFVAAVKLGDSVVTSINVLPFRDYEGLSKYVAVGDDQGRVYLFTKNGDVLLEFVTTCESPVTAMLSYTSVYKNQSILVTGHQNGVVLVHKLFEVAPTGEEWSSLSMESVSKLKDGQGGGHAITILEVHPVGRLRYIVSSDMSGQIRVFNENGTIYGTVTPSSRPLAFLKQRLLFLTEKGAASLDLRSMRITESKCEGLNHSIVRNYVFDATERSKAYGFTSEGHLIHVLLLGDVANFKCRLRSRQKFEMDEPLNFQAIKGYLLIVNKEKIFVYNVSSQHYGRPGAPRLIFSAGLDDIISSFLNYQMVDDDAFANRRRAVTLIATDREKLVVLSLGDGYVGMYRSNLPVFKGEFSSMIWTSPVLFFIVFLIVACIFFAKKREALTSWGPDDPFITPSATNGAPIGSTSGDRSFVDTSNRGADIIGLRGPSRRYVSPSRYAGGDAGSYRPSSSDPSSRPASVDPNFRATSELKFRGSALESSGFPKRRDSLFVNSQVLDDSN